MTCAFSVFTVFHSCSSEICEHKTQFFNLSVVSTEFLYVGLSCLPRTWSFTAACILSEMLVCWSSSSCLLPPFHLPHPPTPPHTFPLLHLSLLLSVCGIGLQLTMVPVRSDVTYTGLITSLASVKNGSLLCVSTEICHLCLPKYITVRAEWMWVYLKYCKKG